MLQASMLDLSLVQVEVEGCDRPRPLAGETTVLAFCARLPAPSEALRAELRGLGATLLLLTPEGGVRLRPDDPPERLRPAPRLWEACSVALPPRLTLVLLDAAGTVRLRRQGDEPVEPGALLLQALRAAGRAVRAQPQSIRPGGVGRRDLLVSTLAAALSLAVLQACATAAPAKDAAPPAPADAAPGPDLLDVTLQINGEPRKLRLDPRTTLLDALRENLGLTGTKKGCDLGQCGACTVLVDGQRQYACLALAAQHEGRHVTTIEGLADPAGGGGLHPMQAAFLEEDALQCGYCTPGQILSAVALLKEGRASTDDELREGMSGNLCRCGAYPNILAAIRRVRA